MDLPSIDHAYGKALGWDDFNAGKLISSWKSNDYSKRNTKAEPDFQRLNKLILKEKNMKSTKFLKSIELMPKYESRKTAHDVFRMSDVAYGRPPSKLSPIKDLING